MQKIYDPEGNEIGQVPLSKNQETALDAGCTIAVLYHTPQMLQADLGRRSGSFSLYKDGDKLVTQSPAAARDFVQLRAAIAARGN